MNTYLIRTDNDDEDEADIVEAEDLEKAVYEWGYEHLQAEGTEVVSVEDPDGNRKDFLVSCIELLEYNVKPFFST